jgi:hypothetical protein
MGGYRAMTASLELIRVRGQVQGVGFSVHGVAPRHGARFARVGKE